MSTNKADLRISTDGVDIRNTAESSDRAVIINLLEGTAHTLRVKDEREYFDENVVLASIKAKKLARVVNDEIHHCRCGKVFASQTGYAGHQNHCEEIE